MYIYIYVIYKKTEISGTIKPYSPHYKCNCSSTLGTVLGYTCRIIGKTQMESLNTGIQQPNSRSTSVDSLGQVTSAKHIELPYLQRKAVENNP